jgi:hypothetical protein
MRRAGAYAVIVLVLLLAAAPTSDARRYGKTVSDCPRGHSHLLAADAQAQVWDGVTEVFACAYGHRRVYALGPAEGSDRGGGAATVKALTGPTVAVERFRVDSENQLLIVSDLRTGRVIRKVHTGGPPRLGPCYVCDGNAFMLVLKEDGSIAWLTEDGRFNIQTELHAVDKKGSRILAAGETDEGTGINPRSLVLGEGVLYWMQGDKPATAPLD